MLQGECTPSCKFSLYDTTDFLLNSCQEIVKASPRSWCHFPLSRTCRGNCDVWGRCPPEGSNPYCGLQTSPLQSQKAMFIDLKHFLSVEVLSTKRYTAKTALWEASPNMELYGMFDSSLEETLTSGWPGTFHGNLFLKGRFVRKKYIGPIVINIFRSPCKAFFHLNLWEQGSLPRRTILHFRLS